MGVLFSFLQKTGDENGVTSWLDGLGKSLPKHSRLGRFPTYSELQQAVNQLTDYKIISDIRSFGDIEVETASGESVWLYCIDRDGNMDAPINLYWKGDTEIMKPIAQELADLVDGVMVIGNDADLDEVEFVFPRKMQTI